MFESVKLCFEYLESNNILITSIFPCLNELRGMITTLAFWYCAFAEKIDVIRLLAIWKLLLDVICKTKD